MTTNYPPDMTASDWAHVRSEDLQEDVPLSEWMQLGEIEDMQDGTKLFRICCTLPGGKSYTAEGVYRGAELIEVKNQEREG